MKTLLIATVVIAFAFSLWGLYARSQFFSSLDSLEKTVQIPLPRSGSRDDLPPQVMALATRLGAKVDSRASFVTLRQTGEMWRAAGAKPMKFEARQSNSLTRPDYIWQARFAPFATVIAADYSVSEHAGLKVYLFGLIPIVQDVGNPEILRGEMMRYLAEIPLAPDAILKNREISWRVVDDRTLIAGSGVGDGRVEVMFHLGDDGLVESMEASARPAQEGKVVVERPWGGRFWDYQVQKGRTVPMQAEVYWVIDGKQFVYWRGRMTDWTLDGQ